MDFDIPLRPGQDLTTRGFRAVSDARTVDSYITASTLDLRPPVDNRPFFFGLNPQLLNGLLLFVVSVASALVVIPVLVKSGVRAIARVPWFSLAFLSFGLGFLLIEIAQMMRLTLLLGHPTFSLSVVLFAMLLSNGAGSFTTARMDATAVRAAVMRRMSLLIATLVAIGIATPLVIDLMHTASTPIRILTAIGLLMPAGFFMGMVFPMAMTIAAAQAPGLGPWLWGINGAASVCASVLTVVIAMRWGIAAAWWCGTACYIAAAVCLLRASASTRPAVI